MRLWSLHPSYMDRVGLVALWREGLLARKVLLGETQGYRQHPQLVRFRSSPDPLGSLDTYLSHVLDESKRRGYSFCADKIGDPWHGFLPVTRGQISYEMEWLKRKLASRSPGFIERMLAENDSVEDARPNPVFRVVDGGVEIWERVHTC